MPTSLAVGEDYHLRRGKDHIIYAGMPSEDVYSIVQMKKPNPYRACAWNLFFPRGNLDIAIDGVSIAVESVSAGEMTFRVK